MNKGNRQFYFSLFRAIALLRGGDPTRAESNGFEAGLVGLMIYAIHYLFFAALFIPSHRDPWLSGLLLVALAFWIWLFWLLLLYLNSVIIKFLRVCGVFQTLPTRRAQSILWGIFTTAMAFVLIRNNPALREFGAIWLVAVAMNLVATLILTFINAPRRSGE